MKVVDTVRRISGITAGTGAWLIRHMVQARTTVEAWMVSQGFDVATRKRWASAVGRMVARIASETGVTAHKERIAIGAGNGWSEAYVYETTDFDRLMETAWATPDAKGRTYADKIG